jgi:hypothetical protein
MPRQGGIIASTGHDEGAPLLADEEFGPRARIESRARFVVEHGAIDGDRGALRNGGRCAENAG